jgi:GNAT superfamily N-acetyltransferase
VPELRTATVADAPSVAALQVVGWRAAYRGLLPDALLDGLSVEERSVALAARLAAGAATVLLAEQGDELLGFASVGPSRDDDADGAVAALYALYVQPRRWRSGIGGLLHAAALQAMRAANRTTATLWVLEGNERAQRFYVRHGWRPDGVRRIDEHGPHLRYRRPLSLD